MLAWILTIGAGICLIYYIGVVLYAGIGTAFSAVWLFFAGFLALTATGVRLYQRTPDRTLLWIPVSMVTLCATGILILLVMQILIFSRVPAVAEPGLDYVIVLGTAVKPEGISKTLKLRLDKAGEYALQNPESILILSGGQGEDEPQSEASAMEDYLVSLGIPKRQLIQENRSTSTVENIVYSQELINQDRQMRGEAFQRRLQTRPIRIGILTSNFHLFRARMIAQKRVLTDAWGIAAPSDRVLLVHYSIRDGIAILKERLMGNI